MADNEVHQALNTLANTSRSRYLLKPLVEIHLYSIQLIRHFKLCAVTATSWSLPSPALPSTALKIRWTLPFVDKPHPARLQPYYPPLTLHRSPGTRPFFMRIGFGLFNTSSRRDISIHKPTVGLEVRNVGMRTGQPDSGNFTSVLIQTSTIWRATEPIFWFQPAYFANNKSK